MAALSDTQIDPATGNLPGFLADEALAREQVEADLTYLVATGVRPVTTMPPLTGGDITRTGTYAAYRVAIRNARPIAGALSLDRQGFALTRHDTKVANFHDEGEVRRLYYPEMARLVAAETGAARVEVFDHNVRIEGAPDRDDLRAERLNGSGRILDRLGPDALELFTDDRPIGNLLGRLRNGHLSAGQPLARVDDASGDGLGHEPTRNDEECQRE